MRRTLKIGGGVMCVGLLVWAVPTIRYYYPTWTALRSPLPLSAESVLHETFRVRMSERYSVDLTCHEVGKFKESWKHFLNSKEHPTLDGDISLRLLQDGREVHFVRMQSLQPAAWSAGTAFWSLSRVELPSSGRYELLLTNHTDLSYLQPTSPTVQIYLSEYYHKNVGFWSILGLLVGAPLFLIGFTIFLIGFFRRSTCKTTVTANPQQV
jgi:hypothetical protein